LPLRTRSDMVKGLLGYTSIEAYIDKQINSIPKQLLKDK
jgi:hypothetical protein